MAVWVDSGSVDGDGRGEHSTLVLFVQIASRLLLDTVP
jgi:hypothetical protein